MLGYRLSGDLREAPRDTMYFAKVLSWGQMVESEQSWDDLFKLFRYAHRAYRALGGRQARFRRYCYELYSHNRSHDPMQVKSTRTLTDTG